ncbi:MAG: hypothetical protein KAS66_03550 [Candidatus Omnitrophica bacterium]|nr:hypothetical protein [Candidatus Omnitrophota bacterium]
MRFEVYRRPDGIEELRLRPETNEDCDEIEECSQCLFENDQTGNCIDEAGIEDHINEIVSRMIDPSIMLSKEPEMSHRSREPTFEEILEKFGFSRSLLEGKVSQRQPQLNILNVKTFMIKNGKVIADPETRELMRKAGILDKIEKSFEEEDEN